MSCDNTSRLLYQYANSPVLRSLLLSLLAEMCTLKDALTQLETRLDIDLSTGQQLDLIGEIVGQPRPLVFETLAGEIFGFDPLAASAGGFPSGDVPDFGWSAVNRADRGGRFGNVSGGALVGRMVDGDYRTYLRARIYSNRASATVDSIGEFLHQALGAGDHSVGNSTPGQVDLIVGRPLSTIEEQIVRSLAPVAAGVRINDVVYEE